ncbi:hypothetical protein D3C72_2309100 [compost metagenome]
MLLNFSGVPQLVELPEELAAVSGKIIGNYPDEPAAAERKTLRPYEARVYRLGN